MSASQFPITVLAPWISAVVAPWGFTADLFHAGDSTSPADLARR